MIKDPPKKAISMDEFMAEGQKPISMDEFMSEPQTPPADPFASAPSSDAFVGGGAGARFPRPGPTASPSMQGSGAPPSGSEAPKPQAWTNDKGVLLRNYLAAKRGISAIDEEYQSLQSADQSLPGIRDVNDRRMGELLDARLHYDKALKSAKPLYERIVNEAVAKEVKGDSGLGLLKQETDGIVSSNPTAVVQRAKEMAARAGMADDADFVNLLTQRLDAHVNTNIVAERADKIFDEDAKTIDAKRDARAAEFIKRAESEKAKAEAYLSQANSAVSKEAKAEAATLNAEYEQQAKEFADQFSKRTSAEAQQRMAPIFDDIQARVNNGSMTVDQANAALKEQGAIIDAEYQKQYDAEASAFNARAQKVMNEVNQRYNRRWMDEQKRIIEAANARIAQAEADFRKAQQDATPEEVRELRKKYEAAWGKATKERADAIVGAAQSRYAKTESLPVVGASMASMQRFAESTASSLGAQLKSFASFYERNTPDLISYGSGISPAQAWRAIGSEMQAAFPLPEVKGESLKEYLDPQAGPQLLGQFVGGMLPSIVAGAGTAAATGGAGVPAVVPLLFSGLASHAVETASIAGEIGDRVLAETGDPAKAKAAENKSLKAQYQLLPAYALDGLPFVGRALKGIPTKALRIGTASATELGTELVQESLQQVAEKNIMAGRDAYDGLGDMLMEMSRAPIDPTTGKEGTSELAKLFVAIAPAALMGGAGQIGGKSDKKALEDGVKAMVAKAAVAKYSESAPAQWMDAMLESKGRDFAASVISGMYSAGHITEQQAADLMLVRDRVYAARDEASRFGLSDKDARVYVALSAQRDAISEWAASVKDGTEKQVLESRAKEVGRAIDDFANGGKRQWVEVGFADGKSLLLDRASAMRLLKDPAFIAEAAKQGDGISIDFNGDGMEGVVADFQGRLMNVQDIIAKAQEKAAADQERRNDPKAQEEWAKQRERLRREEDEEFSSASVSLNEEIERAATLAPKPLDKSGDGNNLPRISIDGKPVVADAPAEKGVGERDGGGQRADTGKGQVAAAPATVLPDSPVRLEGEPEQPKQQPKPKKKEDANAAVVERDSEVAPARVAIATNDDAASSGVSPPTPAQAPPGVPLEDAGEVAKSKEAVSEEGVSKEVKSVTEGMGIDWNDSANLTDALDDLKHDWGKDIASVEAGKEPVLSVADVTEAKKAIADIEARIKELAPAAPLKAPKKKAPKKEVSAATDERKPEKKQEEPPKTPTGWKRSDPKSVEKPTAITDEKNKTIVAYSIPGYEDIPIVSVKTPKGWRAAIKVGGNDMLLGSENSAEGTPSLAASAAWRLLEKHGREKVEAMVEKSINEQQSLADRIDKAADELEAKLKGMAGAFPVPPQIIVGAMRAAAKVVRAGSSVVNAVKEAIAYIRGTDWYKKLSDADKGKAEREVRQQIRVALEPREPKGPSPSEVKKAAEKDTVKREVRKVTMSEVTALKEQIRAVARGARDAVADVAKARKGFVVQVKEALSKDNLKGSLSDAQARSIAMRAAGVNPLNPKAVDRFIDYAEKVVAKANYSADLEAAESAKTKLRSAAKRPRIPVNIAEAMRDMSQVDVELLSDPLKYASMAEALLAAASPVKGSKYAMADIDAITDYLASIESEWLRSYGARLAEDFGISGIEGIDAQDIIDAIEGGELDAFADNLEQAKRAALKARMVRAADYTRMGLRDADASWMQPDQKRLFDAMLDADLSMLTPQQLADYIFAADNIIINRSTDGTGAVQAALDGALIAQKTGAVTSKHAIRTDWPTFGFKLGDRAISARDAWRDMMHAVPNAMVRLAGFTRAMGDLTSAIGIADIIMAKTKVDKEVRQMADGLERFLLHQAAKAKRNGRNLDSADSRYMEGIVGLVMQGRKGRSEQRAFEMHKALIEQDIEKNAESSPKEYAIIRRLYDKYVKDAPSIGDVLKAFKKDFPENAAVLDYLIKMGARRTDEVLRFERSFRNHAEPRLDNWIPIRFVPRKATPADAKDAFGPDFDGSRGFARLDKSLSKPMQSANLKQRAAEARLPEWGRIDYNARRNTMQAISRNLFDARVSPRWAAVRAMLMRPDAKEVLGGEQNVAYLTDMLADLYEAQIGLGLLDKKFGGEIMDAIASGIKGLSARIGLAGMTQIIQQPSDQLTNAYIMSSAGPGDFIRSMRDVLNAKDNGLGDFLSMGAIGERGELLAGTKWSSALDAEMSRLSKIVETGAGSAVASYLEGMNRKWFKPLAIGDVISASTAWVQFYKKHMAASETPMRTWHGEKEALDGGDEARKAAFAYAEMMTNLTQGPSDPAMFAKWARRSRSGFVNLFRVINNPYGSFPASMRARLEQAASEMRRYRGVADNDPSKASERERFDEAARVMAATSASSAAFEATKMLITRPLIALMAAGIGKGIQGIVGAFGDDDDEKENLAETLLSMTAAVGHFLHLGAIIDRDMASIFSEADRQYRERRRMGLAYDNEAAARKKRGEAIKVAIANYITSMTVSGTLSAMDDTVIDNINRMWYWSELLDDAPSVVSPSGKVKKFDDWLKNTENTPLVRYGQGRQDNDWGAASVIRNKFERMFDAAAHSVTTKAEREEMTATRMSYESLKVLKEDSRALRGFVKRMKESKTEAQRRGVASSFDEWLASRDKDPKKRQALGKAFMDSLKDAEKDPWLYIVKGISDSKYRAAAILSKMDGMSTEEQAMLGAQMRQEGILTPMVAMQMAKLQAEEQAEPAK